MNRSLWIIAVMLSLLGVCWGDKTKDQKTGPTPLDQKGRFDIIRALDGEFVFVRKPFPMGVKGLVLKPDGRLIPDGQDLQEVLAINGKAAMPGDRARITNLIIKKNMILFEINGGPLKKKKWWQRVEVGGMGGMTPVDPRPEELAQGSYLAVEFDKFVPQITPDQLKDRIAGIFDFHAKNSLEAYVETIPPKAKQAIKEHRVLVGMNREMVLYSIGKPDRKIRENDNGQPYEEWIYGWPPQEVKFVRFVGEEVTRLEIMQVDGQKIVHTAKEVDLTPAATQQASAQAPKTEEQPANAPTLRRPGENPDEVGQPVGSAQHNPSTNRPQPDMGDPSAGRYPGGPPMTPQGPGGPQGGPGGPVPPSQNPFPQ